MRTSAPALIIFDGYRGLHEGHATAAGGLEALIGSRVSTYWNYCLKGGDSLRARLDRALEWLEVRRNDITEINVIGLSMGCQIAVRFVNQASTTDASIEFGELVLVAPDPKYRPVGRDAEEIGSGTPSAFDEAEALWGNSGLAGPRFVAGLLDSANRMHRTRIVYCRSDGVAEWNANVELMVGGLPPGEGIELVEAIDGEEVSAGGMTIDLGAGNHESDVHDRLWESINFRQPLDPE